MGEGEGMSTDNNPIKKDLIVIQQSIVIICFLIPKSGSLIYKKTNNFLREKNKTLQNRKYHHIKTPLNN